MFWSHYKENADIKVSFFCRPKHPVFKTKTCKALVHTIQKISPKYLWIYWWITFFIHSFSRLRKSHYIKEYTSKK